MSHDKTSNRIKMRVMGISYNKIHNDAYALILAQENGPYRIPVIIGSAEAQAIAIKMEILFHHGHLPMTFLSVLHMLSG